MKNTDRRGEINVNLKKKILRATLEKMWSDWGRNKILKLNIEKDFLNVFLGAVILGIVALKFICKIFFNL